QGGTCDAQRIRRLGHRQAERLQYLMLHVCARMRRRIDPTIILNHASPYARQTPDLNLVSSSVVCKATDYNEDRSCFPKAECIWMTLHNVASYPRLPVRARTESTKKPAMTRAYVCLMLDSAGCCWPPASLPLDGCRRLARHVVGDAGDALDLVDDAVGDLLQQLVGQVRPAGGHEVDGFHGAQGDDPGVAAAVADHADRLDRLEDHEGLADLVVPVEVAQFLDEDVVGATQQVGVFLLHLAEDAHAQARTWEGVAVDHVVGQAQLEADLAHLVLEQLTQRLDQLEVHLLGQTADVVVALDDVGLAGLGAGG